MEQAQQSNYDDEHWISVLRVHFDVLRSKADGKWKNQEHLAETAFEVFWEEHIELIKEDQDVFEAAIREAYGRIKDSFDMPIYDDLIGNIFKRRMALKRAAEQGTHSGLTPAQRAMKLAEENGEREGNEWLDEHPAFKAEWLAAGNDPKAHCDLVRKYFYNRHKEASTRNGEDRRTAVETGYHRTETVNPGA